MIHTSFPELNAILPNGSFPNPGLTIISGPHRSGKTLLLIDIVRQVLADPNQKVLVVTRDSILSAVWDRLIKGAMIQHQGHLYLTNNLYALPSNLNIFPSAQTQVVSVLRGVPDSTLVVVDDGPLTGEIQVHAQTAPVIYATRSPAPGVINISSAHFSVELATKCLRLITLVKNREGQAGQVAAFSIRDGHLESKSTKRADPPSRWEVLMRDDDL